ncbi:Signal recognition particle subunit srp72 [Cyphellophora attinorum]|uniref:Signal recognition particle subunit SRP72 n=1 Tax=Cyphellophora attinorum TaxID=1664694 RepID=A0A0N0NJX7_9EURO|nr:Signal recognition particle subunit srp72 [Phialophora attinorum]KPI37159.1 Signal recognition particle subunit srp72 [Phialophora attinorum]
MAATTPLLAGLLQKATIDDHDEILRASNAALKKSSSDKQAQDVQVVALIKLDRFDEAYKFIQQTGSSIQDRLPLECAYVLYKTGHLKEAADLVAKSSGRGALHLEAQAQYRLENSARALELYEQLRQDQATEEKYDIRVNRAGAEAQNQWLGSQSSTRPSGEDLQQFETAYNAACSSIARQEFAQAEMLLKRAYDLCKNHAELEEEQKDEELLPIRVQQIYVLLVQGKTEEADAMANDLPLQSIADKESRTVAQSNSLLTSSRSDNPFLLHKTLQTVPKLSAGEQLFSYQAAAFASNKKTVDLAAMKYDGLSSTGQKKSAPLLTVESLLSSIFRAAAIAENETSKAAARKVDAAFKKSSSDIGLALTLTQIHLLIGDTTSAVSTIQSLLHQLESSEEADIKATRHNPGLISILVGLYRRLGRKADIKAELAKSAAYWRTQSNAPPSLLRAAGSSLLESEDKADIEAAAEMFSKLRQQRPDDKAAIAGYVASHADGATDEIRTEAERLTSVSDLTRNINVDDLERAGIPQASNALAIAVGRSRKRAADGTSSRAKKVRKSRLPKDYDPNKNVDPERWLPMRDRSYYRAPKGKKKGKKGGGETQGGIVNESLDAQRGSGTSTLVPAAAGGGGGKKKKGKR